MVPIRKSSGFSLVEMAIVLVITGLILGTVIGAMNVQVTGQRIKETQERQRVIKDALINYIRQNSKLPCPALITLADDHASAGIPNCTSGTNSIDVPAVDSAFYGAIPWKELGLSPEAVKDAYGRRFTYIVTYAATLSTLNISGLTGNLLLYPTATDATANTNRLNPCNGTLSVCDNLAVVAIISHGANGYGAYSNQGSLLSDASASDNEKENSDHANLKLVDGDFNQQSFDDYVLWVKPSELLQPLTNSGAVLDARAFNNIQFERFKTALASAPATVSGVCYVLSNPLPTPPNDAWGNAISSSVTQGQLVCGTNNTPLTVQSVGMDASNSGDEQNISPTLTVADLYVYLHNVLGGP